MTEILFEVFVYLGAAVIAVPLSKQLGLGSVLGYLIAGIVIGPALGLVGDETKEIQHVAEFGVVMMLFLVGLELEPEKLWSLRHKLFGLGGLQLSLTTLVIFIAALGMGYNWSIALAIGLVLALSSTAIVLQTLNEKGLMQTQGGQSTFSVLLFQDIAVIPMLALLPLLAMADPGGGHADAAHGVNLIAGLPGWQRGLITLAAIASIILGGHYLTRPIFRYIAKARLREVFTAFALLLVVGIAVLMSVIGLSPALGTFLAGVVLANSEYRHELESNIDPFKGLLLGLFFITVGAGINFQLLSQELLLILSMTLGVMLIKGAVLFVLGKIFGLKGFDQWLFALALAQAGEFGFVLLSFAVQNAVLPVEIADQLLLVVAMSMLLTPALFIVFDKLIVPKYSGEETQTHDSIEHASPIIIAGHGRFGQMVNRILQNCGYETTVIDLDIETTEGASKFGFKTYFGDATRPELLASAGIEDARLLVVAIDDKERALQLVSYANRVNPDIKIVARAFDRLHTYDLYQAGARNFIVRETFDSAVRAGRGALEALGHSEEQAREIADLFFARDRKSVLELAVLYDPELPRFSNDKMIEKGKEMEEETTAMVQAILGKPA